MSEVDTKHVFEIGAREFDVKRLAHGVEALLRAYPNALVCAITAEGLIVPMPRSVSLGDQQLLDARAVTDVVCSDDRMMVVTVWWRAKQRGSGHGEVHLLSEPTQPLMLYFFDLRELHGVLLGVLVPTEGSESESAGGEGGDRGSAAAPRFSTLIEDAGGVVLDCDRAFTQMFGYEAEELIGKAVLNHIHPDDQARAVEGWVTMLSSKRVQQTRLRRQRRDGTYVWVDTTLHNYLHDPERRHVLIENIDVSAEMAAQEALQQQGELLRRLIEAMPDGLLQLDPDRNVVYCNSRLLELLRGPARASEEEAAAATTEQPERSLAALLATLTADAMVSFEAALGEVLEQGVDRDVEVEVVLSSGEHRRVLMTIRVLLRGDGHVSGAIASALDVTDSARARLELERRATFDALTHCHNRSSILTALERELEHERHGCTCVLYVDLDGFKAVNDTLGHAAGDELLALAAERLRSASRGEDDVGRLGGDEFLVLMRDIPECARGLELAERIGASLRDTVTLSSGKVQLRASIGVACTQPGERVTVAELIERADTAMYSSKGEGRGSPVFARAA
ncbi:MAG TPA: sensor domain-containing diguanylate cyclase [Solirubrobacteraceae bacterium]|nr:sensor domain-containing diguanylate cyclase [Solirubrobacteraceae bacterium]